MSYTVLARRYRSRDFDEIIGQEPIAQTLRNAIEKGRSAHAYLFCGTRGVGKTSMARIFAKALNVSPELAQADAIGEAILRGDDLDVIEIDGASNRGIQEARDLIAGAGLSPTRCPYKIYIIDEVHMLTKPAFNALLKTMEEPPSHVKFILCTTDPQEVPATIQSRCQRFDFRPIPTARIAEQLEGILKEEGVKADPAAVHLVARQGNGSMRDALSLLDRLLATGEADISIALAEQMLGVPDQSLLSAVADAIAAREPSRVLAAGDDLLSRGISVEQALDMLAEYLRNVLLVTACGSDSDLIEMSDEAKAQLAAQAEGLDPSTVAYLIAVCDAASRHARSSTAARALYDAALVRMALHHQLADLPTLLRDGGTTGSSSSSAGTTLRKKKDPEPRVRSAAAEQAPPPVSAPPEPSAPVKRSDREVEPKPTTEAPPTSAEHPNDGWKTALARADQKARQRLDQYHCVSEESGRFELAPATNDPIQAKFITTQADRVAELLQNLLGRPCRVVVVDPPNRAGGRGGDDAAGLPGHREVAAVGESSGVSQSSPAASAAELNEAQAMPLVRKAMELFEARVMQVSRTESADQSGDAGDSAADESQES